MIDFIQRKFFPLIMSCIIGICLFASCSSTVVENYIPNDALGVACVNFKSIAEKGEFDKLKDLSIVKELRGDLREDNSRIDDLLGQFMDNPASCGLDLREDLAVAVLNYHSDIMFEVVAKMHNKKDFEKFLNTIFNGAVRVYDDFSYVEDEEILIAWDKKVALLLLAEENRDLRNEAANFFKLSSDRSIASNNNFKEFWENRGDISVFVDFGNVLNSPIIKSELVDIPQNSFKDIENGACMGILKFEEGSVNLHVQTFNIENQDDLINRNFNDKLLKYMPENTLAAASLSLNMKGLIDILNKEDEDLLRERLVGDIYLGDFLRCLNGSIAFSISDITREGYDVLPVFTITADLSPSTDLKRMLEDIDFEYYGDYYVLDDDELYLAIKGDVLVITNNPVELSGNRNGMRDIAGDIKSGFFAYGNLNIDHYPEVIKNELNSDTRTFLQGLFSSCNMKSPDKNSFDITLSIPSGNQNSLAYLIKLIDNYCYKLEDIVENIYDAFDPYPPYYDDYAYGYGYGDDDDEDDDDDDDDDYY